MKIKPPQFYSRSLELVTIVLELVTIVIVVNVVIGSFSEEDLKMIGSCNCPITGDRLQPTVRLQLCRLIRAKYSSSCISHI